jgi:PAS domain S-box-containing protein
MQVLIVDHEQSRLLDTSGIYRAAGHQILGASTGTECLRTAKEKRPDLILLEAALPDVSGIDLAREIKRDPQLAGAYVVLLVAEDTPSSIQARALEGGADGCLERSLPSRELLARTEAMLRRRRGESAMESSLQQWRDAFDALQDAVYLVDMEHTIMECNLALAKLLGKPPSEIIGHKCHVLVHGESGPIDACLHQRVQETRQREKLVVPMRKRWLEVVVDPILDAQDNLVGSVHTLSDITERRREEEARSESRKALEEELWQTRTTLQNTTEQLHRELEDRQQAEEALSQAHSKLEVQAEEYVAAQAQAKALQDEASRRKQVEDLLTQARVDWEEQAKTLHDQLDRSREALQEAEATVQLQKAQRMEAIRRLAGGLARQLGEFLSVILGSAELALTQSEPDYPAYNELSVIQRTARRIAEWTRRLSTIHRRQLPHSELLDLNSLVSGLTKLIRRLIGRPIDLELVLEPEMPPIVGDAKALEHLLLNLAESARLRMPEGGILRIETGRTSIGEGQRQAHPEWPAGDYVRLTVVDSGAGMDEGSAEQLFEPFFAAEAEEGHGLELAEVQAIVEQHGGRIEVRDEPGQGRRFDILLPAQEWAEEAVPEAGEEGAE